MSEVVKILRNLGWRVRTTGELTQCVRNFQRAYNLGDALVADGVAGPKTLAALRNSDSRRRQGKPDISAHFSAIEFRCKCGGRYTSCARIWVRRSLIREMEQYRSALGAGISIVSGCRCVNHNRAVGGVRNSRHLLGDAADFAALRSLSWFADHHLFSGRGYNSGNGKVRHGDTRQAPTIWRYS